MNTTNSQNEKEKLTPLMQQYIAIKSQYPDTILLYRMGDFYEMFYDDAKVASKILGITLTSRNHGGAEDVPLAGFPYHALDRYANRFIKAGYKIAICEQIEDPKTAKGVVKREIVEIISAGTATEGSFIEEKSNNFIVSVVASKNLCGLSICDLSTGLFEVEEISLNILTEELLRIDPSEVLVEAVENNSLVTLIQDALKKTIISKYDSWKFSFENALNALTSHFNINSLDGLGLEGYYSGIRAAGGLLLYLKEQKKNDLKHISIIKPRSLSEFAQLDASTIRNLELLRPMHADDEGGTLLSVLDKTSTALGARLLKTWITHPLKDIEKINQRLDCVAWLKSDVFTRSEIEVQLKLISDIERLIQKITCERANARDVYVLAQSLDVFPKIVKIISNSPYKLIKEIRDSLTGFEDIVELVFKTLVNNPPLSIREGGFIKSGVSKELDELRDASINGKKWIASLQESERKRTGISSLKVGYNKVFGYYIEVSKANLDSVPQDYIRKQTLVNAERFITPELKDMESKILGSEEKCAALEYEIFVSLRKEIAKHCLKIQKASYAISLLDVFISLANVAAEYQYTRPVLTKEKELIIKDGRHPVVERMLSPQEQFIPNDTECKVDESQILLITGPNMAGKSTYLRQNALIAIMAQMGSFVSASYAQIGIIDKFFTRIGASDRLARGQSTFFVEMIEVANILNNATSESLVLLDEVGRGTSTFDGISIAWAVAEFLHESNGHNPRTFFATHYHELTELALLLPRIKNLHIKVKEWNDKIIFLRKIDEGSCDHAYGIQVARLAGVPKPVIIRAKEILSNLESMEFTPDHKPILAKRRLENKTDTESQKKTDAVQLNMIDALNIEIIQYLKNLDTESTTPLEALNILFELKAKAQNITEIM